MRPGRRLIKPLSVIGALLAIPQVALAGDEIKVSGDVSPTVGYSNNPFARTGSDLGSAYVEIEGQPEVRWVGPHDAITITGRVQLQHYFRLYRNTDDEDVAVDYTGQPSARLTTNAHVSYDSSITGGFDALNLVINPTQPAPPPTTAPNLTVFGTQARRGLLDLTGDAAYILSPRDSVTVSAYYDQSRYHSLAPQASFDGYGGNAGYSRRISERLQLGARAGFHRTVYQGLLGKSEVYSLEGTVADNINSRWNLTGSLGASYSKRTIGGNRISPTGNLQLCRVGPRTTFCIVASEAVQPTSFVGTVVSRMASANYSYRLSAHSDVSLSASYSHNGYPGSLITGNNIAFATGYVTTTASYDRTLRERLHVVATTRYRAIIGGVAGRPSDFGGTIGFSVELGDYK